MRERDMHDKLIWWRFLHIPKNSDHKSSCPTDACNFFNEEKSIIGFPSGRRTWHNRCTTLSSVSINSSSIGGEAGNVCKNFPALLVEHSEYSIRNFFRLPQPAKSAGVKFLVAKNVILVRVGRWRRGRRAFRMNDDVQSTLVRR